ncbi:MAG TPA: TPM domain-containing protein [Clostridia bacterium]|nr:TPM domain-containing protein [Clostridia bacterium]
MSVTTRPARRARRAAALAASLLTLIGVATGGPTLLAADDPTGPPSRLPAPIQGQAVYDEAGILSESGIGTVELVADHVGSLSGGPVAVYTHVAADAGRAATAGRAADLLRIWALSWPQLDAGIVVLVERDEAGEAGAIGYGPSDRFLEFVPRDVLDDAIRNSVEPVLATGDLDAATTVAVAALVSAIGEAPSTPGVPPNAPPPGPPFPDPVDGRAVYDYAGAFSDDSIAAVEATIDRIEARTKAEIVVYTQVDPDGTFTERTERHAIALIDQWGVGRFGIDDGLAIFFDFDPGVTSGEVQLYAAPGFAATYLTNAERQAIFENDMLPHLRIDDWDAAILAAMDRIDDIATPDNAARLERGRQLNAVVGILGAPGAFFGLVGWGVFWWRRYGRDPVYLDSPSIYLPAPPPDLTAASGAMIVDGRATRRALTTALLDLASRGAIAFRQESELLGLRKKVGVEIEPEAPDALVLAQRQRNDRRPIGPAEQLALRRLRPLGATDGYIEPDELLGFGAAVDAFNAALEAHVVKHDWFREKPSAAVHRWVIRGGLAMAAGGGAIWIGLTIPADGLVLLGGGLLAAGVVLLLLARFMPAVTMPGAMIRAMLAAYRRTLKKTMEQSRSMDEVVATSGLAWLDTPDQAIVWGTALGLQGEIEEVLERSVSDLEAGRVTASSTYLPTWFHGSDGRSFAGSGSGSGGGSIFSSSGIPNIGGMLASLGTIGNSPSSSGGGGGGFSGGSSGGGGGGAGGGF